MKLDKAKLTWMLLIGVAVAGLTLWGSSTGTAVGKNSTAAMGAPNAKAEPAQAPPDVVMPAGTPLRIRLDSAVGTAVSRPGDRFTGTLASPAVVNGAATCCSA